MHSRINCSLFSHRIPFSGILALTFITSSAQATPPMVDKVSQSPEVQTTQEDDDTIQTVAGYGPARLSEVEAPYGRVALLQITGSHYDMGYQYGRLVGSRIPDTWSAMMHALADTQGNISAERVEQEMAPILKRAWTHLEEFVPTDYLDEMAGIEAGARDAGVDPSANWRSSLGDMLRSLIVLTEISSSSAWSSGDQSMLNLLITGNSVSRNEEDAESAQASSSIPDTRGSTLAGGLTDYSRMSAFFAVWGSRTTDGHMLASRNLEWPAGHGFGDLALITVYRPEEGHAYATFGFAGIIGALSGMNDEGIALSQVGSPSALEKLKGEPWSIRLREALEEADSLRTATPYLTNEVPDPLNRPTTMGMNILVADGDPQGGGEGAQAGVFEMNGAALSFYQMDASCGESPRLYHYGADGRVFEKMDYGESSMVNMEAMAKEIDGEGTIRTFLVEDGVYVRDERGYYIDDPHGIPMDVGMSIGCALFRGAEAMGYGVRIDQVAANGPAGDDPHVVMVDSSSYQDRYAVIAGILNAWWTGAAYTHDGIQWVPAGTGSRAIDMHDAVDITKATAMSSNVMNVVYDATAMSVSIAFESGSASSWTSAANAQYLNVDVQSLFSW